MDGLGDNVVDADSVEVVEYPALLVVEGIHRRRMLFEPQFHSNDILLLFVFDNSGVRKCLLLSIALNYTTSSCIVNERPTMV